MPEQPLRNQVAVVAGATRGAGRGIARMLGSAGTTVYCTGRSVRGRPATPGRPETIKETASLVTAEGRPGHRRTHGPHGRIRSGAALRAGPCRGRPARRPGERHLGW